jgi:hypothetical protein
MTSLTEWEIRCEMTSTHALHHFCITALVGQDVVDDENWTSKANYLIPQNEDEKADQACSRL